MTQENLLRIVKTWELKPPEYRGFRCANCQKGMYKAWHHWLKEGGYITPVHFCNGCESEYSDSGITVVQPEIEVVSSEFDLGKFPVEAREKLAAIPEGWVTDAEPVYKPLACDDCGSNVRKAYHVWVNLKGTLVEEHFCGPCGDGLDLNEFKVT